MYRYLDKIVDDQRKRKYSVSPQLTPSFNTSIDLRPLSKIKYTHDKGN